MPMLIDVSRIIRRSLQNKLPTGIDRVQIAYLKEYSKVALGVIHWGALTFILSAPQTARLARLFDTASARPSRSQILGILLLDALSHRQELTANTPILNIGHSGLESPRYIAWIERHRLRLIAMIHDLIPMTHPQFSRAHEDERHRKRMTHALTHAHQLIFNSRVTQESFFAFAKQMGIRPRAGIVNHLPPAALQKSTGKPPLEEPYFLMIGTLEGRKNHALILHVWGELLKKRDQNCPKLVMIGQRGWQCEGVFRQLDQSNHFNGAIIEKNNCSDDALSQWLTHAQALLFPSFVEGYGLPLIEAMSLGTPVIASRLPVFQEIAGDIPLYLDPNTPNDWLCAIEDFCNSKHPQRQAQLALLQTYKPCTWNTHFQRLSQALQIESLQ